MNVLTKTAYAQARGVSLEAVRLWRKKGWLVMTGDGKVDVDASDMNIARFRSARGGKRRQPGDRQLVPPPLGMLFREFAATRGVSGETVRNWKVKGWLVVLENGKIDPAASDLRIAALRSNHGGKGASFVTHVDERHLTDARRREQIARSDMAELERDVKAAGLLDRGGTEAAARQLSERVAHVVLGVPAAIAARIAATADPHAVERLLDAALRRALIAVEAPECAKQVERAGEIAEKDPENTN